MNKKGFTLVELLAVIVILAVILVIAVPNVLSIIEKNKKGSFEATAKMMGNSAKKVVASNLRYVPALSNRARIIPWKVLALDKVDKDADGGNYSTSESYVVVVNYEGNYHFFITLKGSKRSVDRQEDRNIIIKEDTVVSETKVGEIYDFGTISNVLVESIPYPVYQGEPVPLTGDIEVDASNIAGIIEEEVEKGIIDIDTFTKEGLDSIGVDSRYYDGFGVSEIKGQVVVTLAKGNEIGENGIDSKVYGVIFDGTNSTLTRTDDAVGLTTTATATSISSDFDNAEIYREMKQETDSYGNVFIRIPKFWIKKTKVGEGLTYQISRTKQDEGYYLPACFYDETSGRIVPYVLVGKYEASLGAGNKLESKSGKPLIDGSYDIPFDFRTYARNNNIGSRQGYQLLDIHVVDIIQTLFYVEFATLDSQSIMAGYTFADKGSYVSSASGRTITFRDANSAAKFMVGDIIGISEGSIPPYTFPYKVQNGRVSAVNTDANQITYEVIPGITIESLETEQYDFVRIMPRITGMTDTVGNNISSGSPVSNDDHLHCMKYRGIENIWGNVEELVDGLNIRHDTHQIYVARNADLYESGKYDGAYVGINHKYVVDNGWIMSTSFDPNNPFIQAPTSVAWYYEPIGPYKDLFMIQSGDPAMPLFGGTYFTAGDSGESWAGLSYCSKSHMYENLAARQKSGTRLVKVPL